MPNLICLNFESPFGEKRRAQNIVLVGLYPSVQEGKLLKRGSGYSFEQ